METGDIVLTPGWCWHAHRHDGDKPAYWFDGLDVPLTQLLGPMRFATYASTGSSLSTPIFRCVLARAYGQQGRSIDTLTEALAITQRTNETWTEAELHRTAGELLTLSPRSDPEAADEHFRESLAIARRQKARSHELRAATGFARVLLQRDRYDEARDILVLVYGWFTEGFGTRDLQEAKALLDDIPAPRARSARKELG
jgi:predicted ATPase